MTKIMCIECESICINCIHTEKGDFIADFWKWIGEHVMAVQLSIYSNKAVNSL